jgi:hypothetical protein
MLILQEFLVEQEWSNASWFFSCSHSEVFPRWSIWAFAWPVSVVLEPGRRYPEKGWLAEAAFRGGPWKGARNHDPRLLLVSGGLLPLKVEAVDGWIKMSESILDYWCEPLIK